MAMVKKYTRINITAEMKHILNKFLFEPETIIIKPSDILKTINLLRRVKYILTTLSPSLNPLN